MSNGYYSLGPIQQYIGSMSSIQPFHVLPKGIDRENINEEITQNALENEHDQMDEDQKGSGPKQLVFVQYLLADSNSERHHLLQRALLSARKC